VAGEQLDLSHLRNRRDFAAELTRLRESAGLTVRDVARALDVPDSTIGGYFSGRHVPTAKQTDLLRGMLRLCGITEEPLVEEWLRALARVRRAPGRRAGGAPVPYRGLSSFQPEDADWYFGRERLTELLVRRLREQRQLTVTGPSGSGKSSLLRAGLVPVLRTDGPVALFTPSDEPMKRYAQSVGSAYIVVDQFEEIFTGGCSAAERHEFIEAICTMPDGHLVLGLRADFYHQALRHALLVPLLQDGQVIVGPMTRDELRRAIVEPAAKARVDLEDGLVELLLHDIAPVAADGDAAHDAGALPLLSHTLLTTWERGGRRGLTTADYREAGGINGAVSATAEEVYASLTTNERHAAQQLFIRLVHVADDTSDTRRRVSRWELPLDVDAMQAVLDGFVEHRMITVGADDVELVHEALLTAWPRLRGWIDADRDGLRIHRRLTAAAAVWSGSDREVQALYGGGQLETARDWAANPLRSGELNSLEGEFLEASVDNHEAEIRLTRRRTRRLRRLLAGLTVLTVLAALLAGFAFRQKTMADRQRDLAVSRQVAIEADKLRGTDPALAAQLALAAYRISPTPEARSSLLDSYAIPAVTRLRGSSGVLQAAVVTADRRTMATAGADSTVRLWDLTVPGHPRPSGPPLAGYTGAVFAAAFSPDGHTLVTGGEDRTVRVWRLGRTPAEVTLTGHTDTVYTVAFSPDGHLLATAGADRTVRLWDLIDPNHPVPLGEPMTGPAGTVQSIAFSPDGHTIAAVGVDQKVWRWSLTEPRHPVRSGNPLAGPAKKLFAVAFSPDGRTLAAAGADDKVWLWTAGGASRTLAGPVSFVNSVTFSPDGRRIAAASSDGKVWIWDAATGKITGTLPHPGPVTAAAFVSESTVVTSAADGQARLWEVPGPIITGPADNIFTVAYGRGHVLAVTGADNTAQLWNVADPHRPVPLGPLLHDVTRSVRATGAAALSPDAGLLAVGDISGGVQLWNVSSPAHPVPLPVRITGATAAVESIAFRPDGKVLVLGADDKTARLWNVADPARPIPLGKPLTGTASYVYSPVFSPDGRTLAFGSADTTVRLWDVTDPARAVALGSPLRGHKGYVFSVAFSPDGRTLATAGADDEVRLWDISDRALPVALGAPLTGPRNYAFSVVFSSDGQTLAASAGDGTIWLWDVSGPGRPRTLATLTGPVGAVYVDAFDTGRPILATAGADRTVRLWDTDPGQAATHICATSGAPITEAEWREYVPGRAIQRPCRVA
jgi:WD40 repeat protein/transcriptional regulator with XRE-family HTH domain